MWKTARAHSPVKSVAAFVQQWPSRVIVMDMVWSTKPKVFTVTVYRKALLTLDFEWGMI